MAAGTSPASLAPSPSPSPPDLALRLYLHAVVLAEHGAAQRAAGAARAALQRAQQQGQGQGQLGQLCLALLAMLLSSRCEDGVGLRGGGAFGGRRAKMRSVSGRACKGKSEKGQGRLGEGQQCVCDGPWARQWDSRGAASWQTETVGSSGGEGRMCRIAEAARLGGDREGLATGLVGRRAPVCGSA